MSISHGHLLTNYFGSTDFFFTAFYFLMLFEYILLFSNLQGAQMEPLHHLQLVVPQDIPVNNICKLTCLLNFET